MFVDTFNKSLTSPFADERSVIQLNIMILYGVFCSDQITVNISFDQGYFTCS